jgi:hypothetical protein
MTEPSQPVSSDHKTNRFQAHSFSKFNTYLSVL